MTISLRSIVVLSSLIVIGTMVGLISIGAASSRDAIDKVVTSLTNAIQMEAEETITGFLKQPFTSLRTALQFQRMGIFNMQRSDAKDTKSCSYWMSRIMVAAGDSHTGGGIVFANLYGHFATVQENYPDSTKWLVSSAPPYSQIKEGVPSWEIPCKYLSNCDNSTGHCFDVNNPTWEDNNGDGIPDVPKWASGEMEYLNDEVFEAYQTTTKLDPPWATWAAAQNLGSPSRSECRVGTTVPKQPCSGAVHCPEFNRSYYDVDSENHFDSYEVIKSISHYDPRSRTWYALVHNATDGEMLFSEMFVCQTAGVPCLLAVLGAFSSVPEVSSVVNVTNHDIGVVNAVGTVTGYHHLLDETYAPVVQFNRGSDILTAVVPSSSVRIMTGKWVDKVFGSVAVAFLAQTIGTLLRGITVSKTGSLFVTETGVNAWLVGTGFPCKASLFEGKECIVKVGGRRFGGENFTAPVVRVSAFEDHAGEVPKRITTNLFKPYYDPDTEEYIASRSLSSVRQIDTVISSNWVKVVNLKPSEITGIDWLIFIVIPQDDFLSDIIKKEHLTITLLCILAVVCVALLVAATYYAFVIPLSRINRDFTSACTMDLDNIKPSPGSTIRELDRLMYGFNRLVGNLRGYRPFLPPSLFDELFDEKVPEIAIPGLHKDTPVAIVFTDIKNSTKIWESCPEGMKKGLRIHDIVIRDCIRSWGGYEVKTIGDAFMVAFETASGACNFAAAVQENLSQSNWPEDLVECEFAKEGIMVRIGVNFGNVEASIDQVTSRCDYFGPTVNLAARVEDVCAVGFVCVTGSVMAEVEGCDPDLLRGLEIFPLGFHKLKGLKEETELSLMLPTSLSKRKDTLTKFNPLACDRDAYSSYKSTSSQRSSHRSDTSEKTRGIHVFARATSFKSVTICGIELEYDDGFDISSMSSILQDVMLSLNRSNGTMITIFSNVALVGWNISKTCHHHLENSYSFVRHLHSQNIEGISVGMACGMAQYGAVGHTDFKFINVIGKVVNLAHQLCLVARSHGIFCLHASEINHTVSMSTDKRLCQKVAPFDENWSSDNIKTFQVVLSDDNDGDEYDLYFGGL